MKGRVWPVAVNRRLVVAMLALGLALVPGCWSRKEINEITFISAVGLDRAEEGIRLTVQVAKPSQFPGAGGGGGGGGGGMERPVWLASVTGSTVFEAVKRLQEMSPRLPFFSHSMVYVIGEDLARAGIGPVLDWLDRSQEPRRTAWLLVARGEARDILAARTELERLPSRGINAIMDFIPAASTALVPTRLGDFLERLSSRTTQPVAGAIQLWENPGAVTQAQIGGPPGGGGGGGGGRRGLGTGGGGGAGTAAAPPPVPRELRVVGTAVFRGDKLAGFLDERETRGLLWVLGEVRGGAVVIDRVPPASSAGKAVSAANRAQGGPGRGGGTGEAPMTPGEEGRRERLTLEVIRARGRIMAEWMGDNPSITVKVEEEGNVMEVMPPRDIARREVLKALEREMARATRGEVEAVLARAQGEWGLDIFGFGEALFRKDPRKWTKVEKEWPALFRRLPVQVQVETRLRRTGMTAQGSQYDQKIGGGGEGR